MTTTAFVTSNVAGVDVNATYTVPQTYYPEEDNPPFAVGTAVTGTNGTRWVFVKASAALVAGDAAQISKTWTAAGITTATATFGSKVGVPAVAIANGSYGWVQTSGVCPAISVIASAAANAQLSTTSTAGQLSDATTAGQVKISGIATTTVNGGSAGTQPGILTEPVVTIAY